MIKNNKCFLPVNDKCDLAMDSLVMYLSPTYMWLPLWYIFRY